VAAAARAELGVKAEVVIIGGGPAGLAAGMALADRGVSVLICESSADPGHKPCGEGLQPAALRELDFLGVSGAELSAAGSALLGVRYLSPLGQRAEGHFARPGLGLRRSELQRLLRARAERQPTLHLLSADARVLQQADGRLGVRVDGSVSMPRLIIGADGLNS
jgi:menaquinone-9 beta-reductase